MKKGWFVFLVCLLLSCVGLCPAETAVAEQAEAETGQVEGEPPSGAAPGDVSAPLPSESMAGGEEELNQQYRKNLEVTGFRVSVTKNKAAKLRWNRNIYAKGYQIYRASSKTGEYQLVKMVGQSSVSYTDQGVRAKEKYFYKIRALGVFGSKLLEGTEGRIRPFYTAGIATPRISVKKGQSGHVRYILVELKYYEEKNVEIYISKNNKKFERLKLVSNKIARYKGLFKIKCMVKKQKIRFKVRTYRQTGKKKMYSEFSRVAGVQV